MSSGVVAFCAAIVSGSTARATGITSRHTSRRFRVVMAGDYSGTARIWRAVVRGAANAVRDAGNGVAAQWRIRVTRWTAVLDYGRRRRTEAHAGCAELAGSRG